MEPIDTGYVDTILTIIVEKQNPEPDTLLEVKREPGEHDDEEHNKELPETRKITLRSLRPHYRNASST